MELEGVPTDLPPVAVTSEEKTWGMLCHLSALLTYIVAIGLVGGTFIGPLICWLIKKDTSRFVDYHGKESLNFQLNILIYKLLCIPLFFCFVGIFVFPVVVVFNIVCVIIASISAYKGEPFKYPFVFRLIK